MRRRAIVVLGLVGSLGFVGCSDLPMNVVTTQGTITERVLITSTTDGYHLTFSTPSGQVTRRLWCDGFSNACIDGK